ncbi:hypothetical protein AB5J52_22995 [Streptomyces sp. R39]|uniref:Uncharacterized protein n=1 Tax=Streptomyces sp. R39 TaxID=3238631 RepID=A0AB39QQH6_9ACTN
MVQLRVGRGLVALEPADGDPGSVLVQTPRAARGTAVVHGPRALSEFAGHLVELRVQAVHIALRLAKFTTEHVFAHHLDD